MHLRYLGGWSRFRACLDTLGGRRFDLLWQGDRGRQQRGRGYGLWHRIDLGSQHWLRRRFWWRRRRRLRHRHHGQQYRRGRLGERHGHLPGLPAERKHCQPHDMEPEGAQESRKEWRPHHPAGFFPDLTAIARPDTPACRSSSRISTTVLCNTCPSALITTASCGSEARAALTRCPISCRVIGSLLRNMWPSCITVRLTLSRISFWDVAAVGRFTGRPRLMVIESVETMKKTRRKKITSIIGMISMRAFSDCFRGIRMSRPLDGRGRVRAGWPAPPYVP